MTCYDPKTSQQDIMNSLRTKSPSESVPDSPYTAYNFIQKRDSFWFSLLKDAY